MKWRPLLLWVILLAVLGGFVYFYEFKGEANREEGKEASEELFPVKTQEITRIFLERGSEKIQILKQNGQWLISSPLAARADQNSIDEIVRNLSSARISRYLSGVRNLSEFGLQSPKLTLEFRTSQGNSFHIDVGEKDYSEAHAYVKASTHSEVLLVPAYLISSMDKTLLELRDRRLMEFESDKVTRVEMSAGHDHIVVEKSGADWRMIRPVAARGDSLGISSFLMDLSNSEAADFVDQSESNLKKYGLDPPGETLTITLGDGPQASQKELHVGAKTGDNCFARLEGAAALFKINNDTAAKLHPTAFTLRDKHLVTFKSEDLLGVTVRAERSVYEFEKGTSKEAQWKVVQPKDLSGKEGREWKIWFPLEEMTADEILDLPQSRSKGALFARPDIQATLKDRSHQTVQILFSKPEKESRWVRVSNSESVFRVPNGKVDDYISGLKDAAEK